MRALILVAGAALALSACGKNEATDDTNTLDVNTIVVDNSADATMDMNAMTDANGMAMNDAHAMDMNVNDADANLANGM